MPTWFAWSLLALVSWGGWAIIARVIGEALTPAQSQALSTLGILPILAALLLLKKRERPQNARKGMAVALVAGVLSCLGNVAYYHALNLGGKAATVVPLTAMYPLVTIVLALLLLKERLQRVQLGGIVLSLLAIYLLNVSGGSNVFTGWFGYALLPIAFWGVTGFLQKLSTNDLPGELSTFWFLATFIPSAVLILIVQPLTAGIPVRIWCWVIALGFFFALGNLAILLAFARNGKASVITPLTALYPVVSIPFAIIFLNEKTSLRETVGIFLALASVAALAWPTSTPAPKVSEAATR